MPVITVPQTYSFEQWRVATELLGAAIGNTDLISGTTIVDKINTKITANPLITAGTGTKITYDQYGLITSSTSLSASDIPNLDWSKITSGKPTTLAGYGIIGIGELNSDNTNLYGSITSNRLMSNLASGYYYDWDATGNLSTLDANYVTSIATIINTNITNQNLNLTLKSSYGNRQVGLGFLVGTYNDVITASNGLYPPNSQRVNSLFLGYSNGPRILISTDDLLNDTANTIRLVADESYFIGNVHVGNTLYGVANLSGNSTYTTLEQSVNDTRIATTGYVRTAISDLINGAPLNLNTLSELAGAVDNDPNFSAIVYSDIDNINISLTNIENALGSTFTIFDAGLYQDSDHIPPNYTVILDAGLYEDETIPPGNIIADGGQPYLSVQWSDISPVPNTVDGFKIIDAAKTDGSNSFGTWKISTTGNAATATHANVASYADNAGEAAHASVASYSDISGLANETPWSGVTNNPIKNSSSVIATASDTIVDSFSVSTYISAKYFLTAYTSTNIHSVEIIVNYFSGNININAYGDTFSNKLFNVDVSYSSGNVYLHIITLNNNTTVKFVRTSV